MLEGFAFHKTLSREEDGDIRRRKDELVQSHPGQDFQIRILNRDVSFQYPVPKVNSQLDKSREGEDFMSPVGEGRKE